MLCVIRAVESVVKETRMRKLQAKLVLNVYGLSARITAIEWSRITLVCAFNLCEFNHTRSKKLRIAGDSAHVPLCEHKCGLSVNPDSVSFLADEMNSVCLGLLFSFFFLVFHFSVSISIFYVIKKKIAVLFIVCVLFYYIL
jgi:hypothetical protein